MGLRMTDRRNIDDAMAPVSHGETWVVARFASRRKSCRIGVVPVIKIVSVVTVMNRSIVAL